MIDERTREELSDEIHKIWIGWMEYLFTHCLFREDGAMVIPKARVDYWRRQMTTPYEELSEPEKDEDRDQVDRLLIVMKRAEEDRAKAAALGGEATGE